MRSLKVVLILFLVISPFLQKSLSFELWLHPLGEDIISFSDQLYDQFHFDGNGPDRQVFQKALKGFLLMRFEGRIQHSNLLSIIDFSLPSNQKRFWVLDLKRHLLLFHEWTAHGKNSGDRLATMFSNTLNSYQSSLGFYITGSLYQGAHDLSLKLYGQEKGINDRAFQRGIVIHGAAYVSETLALADQIGRSFGCPAVRPEINRDLIETIAEGSCLFAYHPSASYVSKSLILNSMQFLPAQILELE